MITLIIPVYNKAPFLKRCLASVANQYDKSAQIVVVDDGSTDGYIVLYFKVWPS